MDADYNRKKKSKTCTMTMGTPNNEIVVHRKQFVMILY